MSSQRSRSTLARRTTAAATGVATALLLVLPSPARAAVGFAEEFDGTRLRPAVWTAETNAINDVCASSRHASVGDGVLRLLARRTSGACRYTGARVSSDGKRYVGYGVTVARIDFNTRRGSWQGFVLFGQQRSGDGSAIEAGEIDAAEITRGEIHYRLWSVRRDDPATRCGVPVDLPFGGLSGWHNYGVEHRPSYVRFLLDGEVKATITKAAMLAEGCTWPFDRPFSIALSNRAGGFGGQPDPDRHWVVTRVDWVRHFT